MAGRIRQFVVYAKVTLIVALAVVVIVVVFMNRNYRTNFWPWADKEQVSTLWLMLATCILSIIVFWALAKTRRVWREVVEIQAEKTRQQQEAEVERRRAALEEQERRIDTKLKQALGPDNSQEST